jgi:hypothetical protein
MLLHNRMINSEERQKLDRLLGAALVDKGLCQRLIQERDHSLMSEYQLTDETQDWLRSVQASSLMELAQAIAPQM